MKTKTFIHISDLHIAAKNKPGIEDTNPRAEKTWLVAQEDEKNNYYIQDFCNNINENFKQSEGDYYLLISGDIADASDPEEYQFAITYLRQIQKNLGIKEDNILIVPGNHDVSWSLCRQAAEAEKDSSKLAYQQLEAKYSNFKDFYNSFFQNVRTFNSLKQIVNWIELKDERILIVGINTNYKINYEGGKGAVERNDLETELDELCKDYLNYSKIAVFHHNIVSDTDENDTHYGSWKKNDWINFKQVLEKHHFKLLLFGNEHTEASSSFEKDMYCSDSGTFALKGDRQSYKVYQLVKKANKTSLELHLFELAGAGTAKHRNFGYWRDETSAEIGHREISEFVLQESKTKPFEQKVEESFPLKPTMESKTPSHNNDSEHKPEAEDNGFHDWIIPILKEEHLFHHGHFHWGKSSRSHNWIDTISLLNDRRHISMIHKEIQKTIKDAEKELGRFDAIVGLGMEGNILSSQLLLDDVPYTYMPYTYRYEDFIDCEKDICLDNNDGKYKNVLIITDVVNKGRTIKSLIEENEGAFFSQVKQICIISLFYTGDPNHKEMPRGLKEIIDKTLVFHSLVQLEVGECPYKDDTKYKEECAVYKHQLCDVSLFYNEK